MPFKNSLSWKAALDYVARGWRIFPLRAGLKIPATDHGFKDATLNVDSIERWFISGNKNIGVATGSVSGLVVIDDDSYKEDGSDLQSLEKRYGHLPSTYTVRTRAGGSQLYYRYPADGSVINSSNGKVGRNVDIKADGGYVVAPPSYVAEDEKGPAGFYEIANDAEVAELPERWVALLAVDTMPTKSNCATQSRFPQTAENIELIEHCLAGLNADCCRDEWRDICFTGGALHHNHGWSYDTVFQLYDDWSRLAGERYDKKDELKNFIEHYDPSRDKKIDIGSLFFKSGVFPPTAASAAGALPGKIRGGDLGNAECFAAMNRSALLFVPETKDWLKFDADAGWAKAADEHVQKRVKDLIAAMYTRLAELIKVDPESAEVKKLRTETQRLTQKTPITNMLDLAAREAGMSVCLSAFDQDGMLLGVANGAVDLSTQLPSRYSPDVLITKRCNAQFDRGAECPRWLEFLECVQPDTEVREYLQRMAGLIALGIHLERVIFFLYGNGANGKSVFIECMAYVLGEYTAKIPTELLMAHRRDPQSASPELLLLKGVRFAFCNETQEGARLDEARVKDLTGGDTITARPLYSSTFVRFQPSHTLLLVGNHRPVIRDSSSATWDRMQLIPFAVTIPAAQRDGSLLDKLKAESSGILNWILDGVEMYLQDGLKPPAAIRKATKDYEDEQDIVGEWISENCSLHSTATTSKAELYWSFKYWCQSNGHRVMTSRRLTQDLEKRGVTRDSGRRNYQGIELRSVSDSHSSAASPGAHFAHT